MNPMSLLAQLMMQKQGQQTSGKDGKPQFDQNMFTSHVPQLNDNILNNLISQAKQQGISQKDIDAGLAYIKKLR